MKVIRTVNSYSVLLPFFSHSVRAGFPSPADDYQELSLDLNQHIILHPSATYFVRAEGESMIQYGIHSGDLLVVDRALEAKNGDVVIAAVHGELTCKVLDLPRRQLLSGNDQFFPIPIPADIDVAIEGVVTCSIRYHRCLP